MENNSDENRNSRECRKLEKKYKKEREKNHQNNKIVNSKEESRGATGIPDDMV